MRGDVLSDRLYSAFFVAFPAPPMRLHKLILFRADGRHTARLVAAGTPLCEALWKRGVLYIRKKNLE